jgi:hypothetical protein
MCVVVPGALRALAGTEQASRFELLPIRRHLEMSAHESLYARFPAKTDDGFR